jgi:lipopolysaccharide/colanic/teichoic acid biosynthesis glycosyltransferase
VSRASESVKKFCTDGCYNFTVRYPFWKRFMDIAGALAGLFVIVPIAPIIIIAIAVETTGPPIIKLDRVSQGSVVKVYKFRSMVRDAEFKKNELLHLNERNDGPFFKIRRDPRVTKVGRVIRRFRIDEFPQLINVLKGELALVGPRPHEPGEVSKYPTEYRPILDARAGVTGYSQVNGASSLAFLKELELDSFYVKNMSPILDIKIIGKTVGILFFDPTAV